VTVHRVERRVDWHDPLAVACGLHRLPGALALISDGDVRAGRSWVAAEPDLLFVGPMPPEAPFRILNDPDFARGVVGLATYDGGARPATGERVGEGAGDTWPDLMLARYPALLRFQDGIATAIGLGASAAEAEGQADRAEGWLGLATSPDLPVPPAETFHTEAPDDAYRHAVAEVVRRIGEGELFQANIARAWSGRLKAEADPFDVFVRLARSRAAAFGAFWRMGDRALVSNSPELFLDFDATTGRIETRPIKGTRGRDADAAIDARLAADLIASAKDRAENLMIVDLMRNDLSRIAAPGSVKVERLFEVETLPTVHHLVSTVTALARPGTGPAALMEATFPPGSITGAPKHQAMKVIADLEPPRGPWCGSLFMVDDEGSLTASVLIRTASFVQDSRGWHFRTLAGAGIVADSDPEAELAETVVKISALKQALTGSAD
jgi:para-aminobenzoate synthetase component 1